MRRWTQLSVIENLFGFGFLLGRRGHGDDLFAQRYVRRPSFHARRHVFWRSSFFGGVAFGGSLGFGFSRSLLFGFGIGFGLGFGIRFGFGFSFGFGFGIRFRLGLGIGLGFGLGLGFGFGFGFRDRRPGQRLRPLGAALAALGAAAALGAGAAAGLAAAFGGCLGLPVWQPSSLLRWSGPAQVPGRPDRRIRTSSAVW
jgi:hypothetical protein